MEIPLTAGMQAETRSSNKTVFRLHLEAPQGMTLDFMAASKSECDAWVRNIASSVECGHDFSCDIVNRVGGHIAHMRCKLRAGRATPSAIGGS